VSLLRQAVPTPNTAALLRQRLGRRTSLSQGPSGPIRHSASIQEALDAMESIDRETLFLRHFEHAGRAEVAQVRC
jgi:hypothetical protein